MSRGPWREGETLSEALVRLASRWQWARLLAHGDHARPGMRLIVTAQAVRDYGRGRRVYRWRAVAEFGRISLQLGKGTARSQRAIHAAVDELLEQRGGEDGVRADLWARCWCPDLAASVWAADGTPALSYMGAAWNGDDLPPGTWYKATPPRVEGHTPQLCRVERRGTFTASHYGPGAILPGLEPWTGAPAKP